MWSGTELCRAGAQPAAAPGKARSGPNLRITQRPIHMEKTGETPGLGTHHRRGAGAGPVPGPPGAAHKSKTDSRF